MPLVVVLPEERLTQPPVANRYRLEAILGQGGFGVVFAARDLKLDRDVCLKFLLPEHLTDAKIVTRFLDEGKAAARIRHANVVTIYTSGEAEDGAPYIVMERLVGESLDKHSVPMDVKQTWAILGPAMQGLAAAHRMSVVHRDLKPDNIFIHHGDGDEIIPKILDFGIARMRDIVRSKSTALLGTPQYMSREQAGQVDPDPTMDVWAMGMIWYRCLTGRFALDFDDETSAIIVITKIATTAPTPLAQAMSSSQAVPEKVAAAVDRALALTPGDRWPDVQAFRSALEAAIGDPTSTGSRETATPPAEAASTRIPRTRQASTPAPVREPTPTDPALASTAIVVDGKHPVEVRVDVPAAVGARDTHTPPAAQPTRWWIRVTVVAIPVLALALWFGIGGPPPVAPREFLIAISGPAPDAILVDGARPGIVGTRVRVARGHHHIEAAGFQPVDVNIVGDDAPVTLVAIGPAPEPNDAGIDAPIETQPPHVVADEVDASTATPAVGARSRCYGSWVGDTQDTDGLRCHERWTFGGPYGALMALGGPCAHHSWDCGRTARDDRDEQDCRITEHGASVPTPWAGDFAGRYTITCTADDLVVYAGFPSGASIHGTLHRDDVAPPEAQLVEFPADAHPCNGTWSPAVSDDSNYQLQSITINMANARACGSLRDGDGVAGLTRCRADGHRIEAHDVEGALTIDCDEAGRASARWHRGNLLRATLACAAGACTGCSQAYGRQGFDSMTLFSESANGSQTFSDGTEFYDAGGGSYLRSTTSAHGGTRAMNVYTASSGSAGNTTLSFPAAASSSERLHVTFWVYNPFVSAYTIQLVRAGGSAVLVSIPGGDWFFVDEYVTSTFSTSELIVQLGLIPNSAGGWTFRVDDLLIERCPSA